MALDALTLLMVFLLLDSQHVVSTDEDYDTLPPSTVQAMQHIDPEVSSQQHNAVTLNDVKECTMKNQDEDSFVDAIRSRTPARLKNAGTEHGLISATGKAGLADSKHPQHLGDLSGQEQGSEEDSFVGKIITRSPAKPMTRIEDSVEAIDAFEEEMEKIGELMPTISDTVSPRTTKTPKRNSASIAVSKSKSFRAGESTRSKAVAATATAVSKGVSQKNRQHSLLEGGVSAKANEDAKHSASKQTPLTAVKRVSSIHKAPFQPAKSTKPPTRASFELPGDAIARKLKDKREERLRNESEGESKKVEVKSVLKPIKSTKPLTHPTFELPGEAVARKLKEQRENRLKQQETDAESIRKVFKARPVRASQAPVQKSNATSKARMSLARKSTESENIRNRVSDIRPASKRPASVPLGDANRRLSTLSVAKRTHAPVADRSARTTRGPSLAATSSRLSISVATRRVTRNGNGAHQSIRGREVFERNKTATEELERLRKEKEEAAKKARVEAAERGRLASRQWAEKQKARKISAEKGTGQNVVPAEA